MIVFDLDGTLTDDRHRQPLLAAGRFAEYHAACVADEPRREVLELLRVLTTHAASPVEIWSGRSESAREATVWWFREWAPWAANRLKVLLRLRPMGNELGSAELKEKWLDQYGPVKLAVDDLDLAVAMWRRRGVTCLQVEPTVDCKLTAALLREQQTVVRLSNELRRLKSE